MGLNYAVTTTPNIEHTIIDMETAVSICDLQPSQINHARTTVAEVIKENHHQKKRNPEVRIVKELKEKPVYYVKADKGNKVVIMNKEDYDHQMLEKINNGPYRQQRMDPLPEIVKRVNRTIKECQPTLGDDIGKLRTSNPTLPRIKGQPKIHKPGTEMREIITANGSPTEKIAKWLVTEFQRMPIKFPSRSVSSTREFAQYIKTSGELAEDDIMVSFDVTALFPSVPVKESISLLEDWLLKQHEDNAWRKKVGGYLKLTRLCMEENYFTFRDSYYKQLKGAPMGNPLSPFLCELFMANLENKLEQDQVLPTRWWRYVDDILASSKKES
ncbi:uncharacterized protein LOC128745997 [Sabethes cyaneus]|uniref:uncharacterized protein LOC128745997 n=1 Tax=Sabethes cyaneus TaxID=53552 RepID=UPI00237D53DF|nr:uncharacterized protein LOC128745997 [Sabethes cyaneus]